MYHSYYLSPKSIRITRLCALIAFVSSGLMLVLGAPSWTLHFGMGCLLSYTTSRQARLVVLQLFSDHLEYKPGWLARVRVVHYDQLSSLRREGPKLIAEITGEKPIIIHTPGIRDGEDLATRLQKVVVKSKKARRRAETPVLAPTSA